MEFEQTARFHFGPIQPILRYLCFLNPFCFEISRSLLFFSWLSSLREAAIAFELLRKTTTEDFTALRHAFGPERDAQSANCTFEHSDSFQLISHVAPQKIRTKFGLSTSEHFHFVWQKQVRMMFFQ
jgi:hypothetical protein